MSEVTSIIRDATDADLLLGLAARGARTVTLKSGKVRISVTVKIESDAPPVVVSRRRAKTLSLHTDPRIRL